MAGVSIVSSHTAVDQLELTTTYQINRAYSMYNTNPKPGEPLLKAPESFSQVNDGANIQSYVKNLARFTDSSWESRLKHLAPIKGAASNDEDEYLAELNEGWEDMYTPSSPMKA